jgi:hypothetical protein
MRNTVGISLEEGLLRYRVLCLNGGAVSEEQFHTAWLDLTGFDVSPIFDKHVFGTTEINFEEALMLIGVKVNQDGSFTAGDPTRFALELFR